MGQRYVSQRPTSSTTDRRSAPPIVVQWLRMWPLGGCGICSTQIVSGSEPSARSPSRSESPRYLATGYFIGPQWSTHPEILPRSTLGVLAFAIFFPREIAYQLYSTHGRSPVLASPQKLLSLKGLRYRRLTLVARLVSILKKILALVAYLDREYTLRCQ